MVDIYVGRDRHHYKVHKDILCKKLNYFQVKFSEEGASDSTELPDATPEAFHLLVKWVYGADLEVPLITREMTLQKPSPLANMTKLWPR